MIFSDIFKKLFSRKAKTIVLDKNKLQDHYSVKNSEHNIDKSIFEILHTVTMKNHINLVYGRVKRGFFKTGDRVDVCNPSEVIPKFQADIINIKTALVDVNKIYSGSEADLLIRVPADDSEVNPGDRVYKNLYR